MSELFRLDCGDRDCGCMAARVLKDGSRAVIEIKSSSHHGKQHLTSADLSATLAKIKRADPELLQSILRSVMR